MVLQAQHGPAYDRELVEVRQLLLELGGHAEECLATAVDALIEQDRERVETVRELERSVNRLEEEVDARCLRMLALHEPRGSDLRFVTMAMKIAVDLERIGDHATNIARRAGQIADSHDLRTPSELPRMTREARLMIRNALDAFVHRSVERARDVLVHDDVVDELHWTIYRDLEGMMSRDSELVPCCMKMLHVIKDLERAADHATNIAEGVIFMVQGRDKRHLG